MELIINTENLKNHLTLPVLPLLLFPRAGSFTQCEREDQTRLGLATRGAHKLKTVMGNEENCGQSVGSCSWICFPQSYAPGWSPASSGGSLGDRSGSGAAGRRGSDPAARGAAAAAAIAEIFSIPALPESWQRLLQKIWLSLSRAVFYKQTNKTNPRHKMKQHLNTALS